ncbi:hypothetical protein BJF82_13235 [Kytococcus sp. CUA-901]|nr:hypothetical protein BJF82_13235 [Kytococcus sp. CUA-901]
MTGLFRSIPFVAQYIAKGRFHNPSLATVSHDLEALTGSVRDLLIDRIHGSAARRRHPEVPWRLTVRESSSGPPGTQPSAR